jgi:hypothetical protein
MCTIAEHVGGAGYNHRYPRLGNDLEMLMLDICVPPELPSAQGLLEPAQSTAIHLAKREAFLLATKT